MKPKDSSNLTYPVLAETDRLHIRPLAAIHVADWVRFMSDEKALEFFPKYKPEAAHRNAAEWIEAQMERYDQGRFGMHALIERSTRSFVGQCGLLAQEIDGNEELEIGFSLLRDYWGQGFATEAATYFRDFAFEHRLGSSLICIIHRDNRSSQDVAQRIGMRLDRSSNWRGLPVIIYRINNPNSDPAGYND